MNCDMFQESASRFMDGLLDASGQAALFAHLSSCTDCRSFLASSVRVREVIRKDEVQFPEGLDATLFERLGHLNRRTTIEHARQPIWRREIHLSIPLAAAALLLVVLAGMLFSVLLVRMNASQPTLESVIGSTQASSGRQTVVVIYQLPEEQIVRMAPAKMFEVNARTVEN